MFNWIKKLFGIESTTTSVVVNPANTVVPKTVVKQPVATKVATVEPIVNVPTVEGSKVAKVKSTRRRPYYPEKPKASPGSKVKPKASPKKSK